MKIYLLAVGQKIPQWAQTAVSDYSKRLSADVRIEIKTVKAEPRQNGLDAAAMRTAEAARLQAGYASLHHPRIIALDEHGLTLNTKQLAQQLKNWQHWGDDVVLLMGGPDGLCPRLLEQAHARIRLSDFTLPHALARVVLVEALYRAWSVNANHPYHRE